MRNVIYIFLFSSVFTFGQNIPSLLIDNMSTQFSNVSLPYWLKAGQTLNLSTNAKSVSILEFNVINSVLEFSQAITLTNSQTVPQNKIWKIEAIGLVEQNSYIPTSSFQTNGSFSSGGIQSLPTIFQSPKKFEVPGTYNWKVPPGVNSICIEVWGGGGGGGYGSGSGAGGGGGGGYTYKCFNVIPETSYTVIVGKGGDGAQYNNTVPGYTGENSSVGILLYATGGTGGASSITNSNCNSPGNGGIGGTGSNGYIVAGENGSNGVSCDGGAGGNGGNGGNGGRSSDPVIAVAGSIVGGGGSGGFNGGRFGSKGARGQVYIYW